MPQTFYSILREVVKENIQISVNKMRASGRVEIGWLKSQSSGDMHGSKYNVTLQVYPSREFL